VLGLLLAASNARAQQQAAAVTFLPATVRTAGLAGAATALVGDAGSVFVNASGLATIKHAGLEGMIGWLPNPTIHTSVAGAVRLGRLHLGGGYQFLDLPPGGALKNNSLWVGSLVYRFGMFALGGTGRYVTARDSSDVIQRSVAGDVSATMAFFDIFALAVGVQNIAPQAVSGVGLALPTTTRLGIMLNLVDPQSRGRLLGTVDVIWTDGQERRTVVGGEAGLVFGGFGIMVRAGGGGQPVATGQSRFAAGGSLVLHQVTIDYAWQEQTAYGRNVHRLGLRLTF